MAPDRGAKLLVPVEHEPLGRERVGRAAEELAVEDAVAVRIGHHEVADPQVLPRALGPHRPRRVVPGAVAVVGVDVVLARVPPAPGWSIHRSISTFSAVVSPGLDLELGSRHAILRPLGGLELVLPRGKLDPGEPLGVEVQVIGPGADRATRGRVELAVRRGGSTVRAIVTRPSALPTTVRSS